jgi:dihydropteroate synthase
LLVGASRKRFLGELAATDPGAHAAAADRDTLTVAVTALVAAAGAWAVRVHEVGANLAAVLVARAWAATRDGAALGQGPGPR